MVNHSAGSQSTLTLGSVYPDNGIGTNQHGQVMDKSIDIGIVSNDHDYRYRAHGPQ
jgi:hypothetical protein